MTTKKNVYYENLCRGVCELSVSTDCFKTAAMEWTVTNYFIEEDQFVIENKINGNKIEHNGSKCINLFDNPELNEGMKKCHIVEKAKRKEMRKEQKQTELVKTYATQVLKTRVFHLKTCAEIISHM